MAVCPLILKFLHKSSQKWLVFANYFGLPIFLPQLANFFTWIYPSYPCHFQTLDMVSYVVLFSVSQVSMSPCVILRIVLCCDVH